MRRDGIFGLVLVELIFADVFFDTVDDLGRNVDDENRPRQEEGSSHREKGWKRLSWTRKTGSRRRRADTWLSEKREEEMYISKEGDLCEVRMAVMSARSALPDS